MLRLSMAVLGVAALVLSAGAQAASTPAQIDFKSCAKPVYPAEALAAKREGTVTVNFVVGADGSVVDAFVNRSSGFHDLDTAAVEALKVCKFTPAMEDGKAVEKLTRVQYVWTLNWKNAPAR